MGKDKLRIIVAINISDHLWYEEEKILIIETYAGKIVRQYIVEKPVLKAKPDRHYQHYKEILN